MDEQLTESARPSAMHPMDRPVDRRNFLRMGILLAAGALTPVPAYAAGASSSCAAEKNWPSTTPIPVNT